MTAVPPKRRGRRYRDRLLDNLEADQPADRQTLRSAPADPRRQIDQRPSGTSPHLSLPTSRADKAEEGIGWGEGGGPDDWGWGLENPTLAAATGSYESELQAQQGAYGKQTSDGWSGAAGESDNWNVSEPQLEADWDDEEEATAEDETADNSPDVTLLDSREVVRQLKYPATPKRPAALHLQASAADSTAGHQTLFDVTTVMHLQFADKSSPAQTNGMNALVAAVA